MQIMKISNVSKGHMSINFLSVVNYEKITLGRNVNGLLCAMKHILMKGREEMDG